MSQTPARSGKVRWISVGTFSAFAVLFALAYGYVPWLKYNWGFNLLRYPTELIAWSITGIALLITTEEARRGFIRAGETIARAFAGWSNGRRDLLVLAFAFALLVLCRERVMLGDSQLLLSLMSHDRIWTYPESGGLFVMRIIRETAPMLGLAPTRVSQILHCGAGAAAVVFVLRAARQALPAGRPGPC